MHPRDQQINEITYSRGVAKCPEIYSAMGSLDMPKRRAELGPFQ